MKKMSSLDKNRKVVWPMCEVTILVCPALNLIRSKVLVTDPSSSGVTNKKQRLSGIIVNEQSTTPTLTQDVNEDLPLDNKTKTE